MKEFYDLVVISYQGRTLPHSDNKENLGLEVEGGRYLENCAYLWKNPGYTPAWKWEKLDKIREAVGLGGPLKLVVLSLSTVVGGGERINRLKTPLSHKRAHIRCKVRELYLSGLQ